MVIRILLVLLIMLAVFSLYLHYGPREFTLKLKKQLLFSSLFILMLIPVLTLWNNFQSSSAIKQGLIASGYQMIDDNQFLKETLGGQLLVTYESGFSQEATAERLIFDLKIKGKFDGLNNLFCNTQEIARFNQVNYGGLYPTAERKLANGYFVGRCYPASKRALIEALAVSQDFFKPYHARFLFLPSDVSENIYHWKFYTETIDVNQFEQQLKVLIKYFDILASDEAD